MKSMRWLILALVLTAGCTSPIGPTPVSTNIVCPTGCVVPLGCHTELSPSGRVGLVCLPR